MKRGDKCWYVDSSSHNRIDEIIRAAEIVDIIDHRFYELEFNNGQIKTVESEDCFEFTDTNLQEARIWITMQIRDKMKDAISTFMNIVIGVNEYDYKGKNY